MKILVQRAAALGDVILTTPVIRRLREENPEAEINVATCYPDVFKNSPRLSPSFAEPDRVIVLDMAYESQPLKHVVSAFMQVAFGDNGNMSILQPEIFFKKRRLFTDRKRYVAVHAAKAGWANRTLPRATWIGVIDQLKADGFIPVLIGTTRDDIPEIEVLRLLNTSVQDQVNLIANCGCFIGCDTACLHMAAATDTPIVSVFTCALPQYRLPYRRGVLGGDCIAVQPDLDCAGCLHDRLPPVTTEHCARGDIACVTRVDAVAIIGAMRQLLA